MKLFLAEGATQTVVSRRLPSVLGPRDYLEFGSVVVVRTRPGPDPTPLEPFTVPLTANWRILGRSEQDYRVLTARDDREDLRTAVDATILALGRWPLLRQHLDLDDPSPAIAEVVWDLAGMLIERDKVRNTLAQLSAIDLEVPADSGLRAETAERAERARTRMARLTSEVAARIDHLTKLADETEAFVHLQEALARARTVIRDADYLLEAADSPPPTDNARELAEHTTAVLAAYNELTR